jgi:hypothetical protein
MVTNAMASIASMFGRLKRTSIGKIGAISMVFARGAVLVGVSLKWGLMATVVMCGPRRYVIAEVARHQRRLPREHGGLGRSFRCRHCPTTKSRHRAGPRY